MEMLSPQDYYNSLPKKPMGAGVLFFNEQNELLIVKPNYKNNWLIPGGTVEEGESPKTSAIREVEEELGLSVDVGQLLLIDYNRTAEGDNLKFVFSGGILNNQQITSIKLQESELVEMKFVSIEDSMEYLSGAMKTRLPFCQEALETDKIVYLENGEKIN